MPQDSACIFQDIPYHIPLKWWNFSRILEQHYQINIAFMKKLRAD
jgi:hypothetical protein